ncbi:MAG: GNAT family N-acetyltransferase [Bacteroidota bacterium]
MEKIKIFMHSSTKIDSIKYVLVAYENEMPVGCGAIKEYSQDTMEVKRMYIPIHKRGQGVASVVLKELEN